MTDSCLYLYGLLEKYKTRDHNGFMLSLFALRQTIKTWAGNDYLKLIRSGSQAKGTAISLCSDLDMLVSLKSGCSNNYQGGLKGIYESLFECLDGKYAKVRRQNVSVRLAIGSLEVDVTPAMRQSGSFTKHSLYVSKKNTWQLTNIQRHILDISTSGHIKEIKILKIWRERYLIDFPSIYLEYLVLYILKGRKKKLFSLDDDVWYILKELSKDTGNPLFVRIEDPANSSNILSDLLSNSEKESIKEKARLAIIQSDWRNIVW